MPATQPGQPVPIQPAAAPEQLVVEWVEPTESAESGTQIPLRLVIGGGLGIAAVLILIGVLAKDFTYYLAATAMVAAGSAIVSQRRKPAAGRAVSLTTQALHVGRSTYPLTDVAGFWLEQAYDAVAVNIEPKKAAMLPITFLYPSEHPEDARQTLLEVLPELEPRQKTAADSLSRFIRL